MHELSLAQNLIHQLEGLAREHGAERIHKLVVQIGPFSGIVADSFTFGFNALKEEQELTRDAVLLLEAPDPQYRCRQCRETVTFSAVDVNSAASAAHHRLSDQACPACGAQALAPSGGCELILKTIEME